jgi:hypothetical protein
MSKTLTDRIATQRIARILGSCDMDSLSLRACVALEDIESDIDFYGYGPAMKIARHTASASRAHTVELMDLAADRYARRP